MFLLKPTGRFEVGCQDLRYCSSTDKATIAADNHCVARLFYPTKPNSSGLFKRLLSPPLTWIRDWHYAKGYVSWGLRNPSTLKEKLLKTTAANTVYALGLTRLLNASYNVPLEDSQGAFPVIVFSHGAASMRNTYSIICTEFASRGFVVAALEHADGTACCAELANGEFKLLQGLGTGAALEAKCDYRVEECMTLARLLQAMNTGADISGLKLSGPAAPSAAFKGLLDLDHMSIMGHSCGGATAAAAVAAHGEFKCGTALDPWWPLLPSNCAALNGWKTSGPLLVLGSQDWNTPGKMWCDGPRQEAVFNACKHKASSGSSSSSRASQPIARGVPVAAAAAGSSGGSSGGGGSGVGGGAIHVVPAGSSHGTFTDLPFLINPWISNKLRKMSGAKTSPEPPVDPQLIQDVIIKSSHTFLQDHLALHPSSPGALQHQQHWEQQQQEEKRARDKSQTKAASDKQAHMRAPEAASKQDPLNSSTSTSNGSGPSGAALQGMGRAESLVDHLAADENLIMADEQQGNASNGAAAAAPPRAHSLDHDPALEQASDAQLAAAAASKHLPVRPFEEAVYKQHLGDTAYLVKVYV